MTAIAVKTGPKFDPRKLLTGSGMLSVLGVVLIVALIKPIADGGLQLFLQRVFDGVNNGSVYAVVAIALVLIFKEIGRAHV